jgi:tetratricopeptide (TPR) repeat protein
MASDVIDWDEDLPADPEEVYQTFVRTLERTDGFRLLFVQCTPAEGEQLIAKVKKDIPQKKIEYLSLTEPIDNLYKIVEHLPNCKEINILFIQGLEHSFYEYEKLQFGNNTEHNFYGWEGVPQILNHLNQQRERFRDDFNICFVFLLRSFAFKYFIHRAPDFFDWRSGVFEFPTKQEVLEQESARIFQEGDYEKYCSLTPEAWIQKVLEIQELLAENYQQPADKANLQLELGKLFSAAKEYETAVESYDKALKIKPDDHYAWDNRGIALRNLSRYEEAINSYDQALKLQPDNHYTWNDRGLALDSLGRYEEAIANYDKAIAIQPNFDWSWNNRGMALKKLGRLEEAIANYEKAILIQPEYYYAWDNRGIALSKLGRLEEAYASSKQALKIKPDDHHSWKNQGFTLWKLGRLEEAVASYDKSLEIKPDSYEAWNNRGIALGNLGRYEEAVASYDKSLEIKPDNDAAWYNKAYTYALQGHVDQAIENLQQAINLNPEYREMAKTDLDFDKIRDDQQFKALIQEP